MAMDGFVFATPDYTVRATETGTAFDDAATALAALAAGRVRLVVGALPFRPGAATALSAPTTADFRTGPEQVRELAPLPKVQITTEIPSRAEHLARVAALVEQLATTSLRKVVAARSVRLAAEAPIDPRLLVEQLIARNPFAHGYAVDLSPSGRTGRTLVGASPEMLVSLRGDTVALCPLAGTAPRSSDPVTDEQQAEKLLASVKNREEHSYVTDWIRERLTPLCAELEIPNSPELTSTPDVWHLATPIRGRLREHRSALELAVLLHPTPAVGGTPVDRALALIAEREEDRGFYGGAVGWCNADGDGDWAVAIRCAELSADCLQAQAYAGGGIVLGSDPQAELDETTAKLRTLLSPFGV